MTSEVVYYEETKWIGWHCDWCGCVLLGKSPRYHVFEEPRLRHPVAIICHECYRKGLDDQGMI